VLKDRPGQNHPSEDCLHSIVAVKMLLKRSGMRECSRITTMLTVAVFDIGEAKGTDFTPIKPGQRWDDTNEY
jgi:hypothetical protein